MTASSRIILQTWKRKDLAGAPRLYRLCQPTWRRYHPGWTYTLLDDGDIEAYVARHFPRFFDAMWHRYPRGVERSDLIRYLFLFREGGLYADLDFECLRSFNPAIAAETASVLLGSLSKPDHPEGIPNALMIARQPKERFWLLVLEEVLRAVGASETIARTGPVALGRAVAAYRAGGGRVADLAVADLLGVRTADIVDGGLRVMPREWVYPICWISERPRRRLFLAARHLLTHKRVKRLFPDSYAVTYWTHAW
jgi:hypothetical protein